MEKNIPLKKILYYIIAVFLCLAVYSCHRKTFPAKTETESGATTTTDAPTAAAPAKKVAPISAKEYLKEKAKKGDASPPPMIVVNDNAARKTADGKYYYELNGYRYWKNNKDGKYYLNGIFNNKSFKKKTKN